ncbi:hypothetical protein BCR42DRAFT_44841 [Absidia repens]|uniref:Calponin-homology (CH) domain-containing protein n=1 Tax=Absidia repens TaxID=90262 RepID=A0A1X2IG74_9FUNG|nr:hypothetical protein BCR42DRAFT_44841 [Absidia repens]
MTTPTSNAISPSSSIYSSSTVSSSIGRSASNRSLYRDLTSATSSNSIAALAGGGRKPTTMGRSRQNTTDYMTGEDLVRTIGSDYQEIQKRALTKWVNTQLKLADDHINNIETDFKDGRKLLKLLSVVSKEPAPKPEKMNMRIHQLANVAQALSFLEKQLGADSIVDMGNEAIVNGDKKKTLALIFFIMIKYQIQIVLNDHGDDFAQSLLDYSDRQRDGLRVDALSPTNESVSISNGPSAFSSEKTNVPTTPIPGNNSLLAARKLGSNYSINSDKQHTSSTESKLALLFWVRIQLEDYIAADIIPSIQDFSRSWRNGLAFCLLIHRHGPDLIPDLFSSHLKDADLTQKQTWHRLLTLAFDLAMNHMDIPRYLDPEDLVDVDYPHEPSVMMYVAEFYKVMSRVQHDISNDQRHEIAIRRRTNIAMVTGGIDNLLPAPDDSHSSTDQHNLDSGMALSDDDESVASTKKKSKKKAHRVSTLADEDKERLKADLNARLMMQLTGHLPRGVNPLLDQLITIHETVLAFIKTNTRTLDEIPTSFDDADTVAEYLDALEIVEEQMQEESSLLDTARDAKDNLMLPPENADDESIRLTDLQRTQVKNLYDMLLDHWTDFEQLLSTTKCDLLRIESDLVDIEEGTHKYHVEADKIMDRIKELQHLLDQIIPHHNPASDDDATGKGDAWHPLDECNGDEQIMDIAQAFQQAAVAANEQVGIFDSTDWKSYQQFILQFSRVILKQVKSRLEELERDHQHMLDVNQETLSSSNDFSRALDLISTTKAIGLELESIHKLMDDNNHTTNDAILDLENQINAVRTSIHNTRETYDNLLTKDERLAAFVNKVQQQYEMVRDWVDQVRVWFIEAERIRTWIEVRIDIIHQRNGSADFDPLSDTLTKTAQDNSKVWHDEHVKLGREIDRFDADDMARLRTHVKTLTGVDRGNRDLSPADTSTIEITLTTLNMLNQLMHLLRQRSYMVDMLTLRIHWDDLFDASSQWILDTDHDITEFLKPGHARWISTDDEIGRTSNSNSVDSSTDDANNSGRRRSPVRAPSAGLMDTEEMIQTLVSLESRVIQFDQSTYSECLDAYQEMEDLHNATLPIQLDTRQSQFEDSFGDLMKRSGFARKVVEQHLALLDIAGQYRQLRDKGESIRISMINSSKSTSTRAKATARGSGVTDGDESDGDVYSDQVQAFKEDSSQLITYVFSRITYTEPPTYTTLAVGSHDRQDNELANYSIKEAIQAYAMQLATIAEALENLLASHRRTLSLQQRATLAYEEMMRLIQWLDERRKMYKRSWLDGSGDDGSDDRDDGSGDDSEADDDNGTGSVMARRQRELDGMLARMEQLEEGELSRLRKRVVTIEDEIDASNALSIDRSTLVNAIEQLDDSHMKLRQLLDRRALELSILGKQQVWEDQLSDAFASLDSVAYRFWTLVDSIRMHVDLNGDYTDNDDDKALTELEQHRSAMDQLEELPVLAQNGSYVELEKAYQQLGALPSQLEEKQQSITAKQQDLKQLCQYAQESAEYKQDLKRMVDETKDAIQHGNCVHDKLVKLYAPKSSQATDLESQSNVSDDDLCDTTVSDSAPSGVDLLQEFKHLVRTVSGKRSQIHAPVNHSAMFDSLQVSLATDGEYADQINKWLDSKHGDLHSLVKTLEQLESHYTGVVMAKKNALKYGDEAKRQLEWIEKHSALLREAELDLADDTTTVTEEIIQERDQGLTRLSNDIITFKQDHVNPLKSQMTELFTTTKCGDTDVYSVDGLDTGSLHELLNQVGTGITQLEQQVSNQSQTLEMTRQYLGWENDLHQVTRDIGSIQEQLYSLTSELKSQAMQIDLTTVDLRSMELSASSIETKIKAVDHVVKDLRNQFDSSLLTSIKKQLLHSSANTVCDRLETRLVGVERSFGRCQDTLDIKMQELGSLKEQQAWQHQMNKVLDDLDNLSTTVDSFVEHKARWHPDLVISENDEIDLRNTWADIKAKLDEYHQHSVQPLQQEIQAWGSVKQGLGGATEWAEKMVRSLVDAYKFVEYNLTFGNEVINQRCLMAAFLWRTSQLEHSAEVIREEFLDQSKQSGDDSDGINDSTEGTDGLADHGERLQRFNAGIEDIRQNLAPTISLPIRHQSASSSSSLLVNTPKSRSSYSGVKDETTNAIIRETIDSRLKRLQDLSNGLQSLLDSKERLTRQEVARVLYIKQLEICNAWIDEQMTKLQTSLRVLDCDAGDDIDNKMIDMQQLRGAIGTAESIETATHGSDSVMSSLQAAYKTYYDTFSYDLGGMDDNDAGNYSQTEAKWDALQKEAGKTTKLLLSALGPAEILNHITHLQQTVRDLQLDISAKDIASLTDDQITQWQKQIDLLDRNNYDAIVRMMASFNNSKGDEQAAAETGPPSYYDEHELKLQLDQVGETILSTRNTLACLYDVVNLNRLCKTYGENAKVAGAMIDDARQSLLDIQQTYKHIDDEANVDGYRDSLQNASQDVKSKTADCKETYDDLCAYSSFIETQKVDTVEGNDLLTEMRTTQKMINGNWKSLQTQAQAIYNLTTTASKLSRGYSILIKVEQSVQVLQAEVNHLPSSPSMDVVATLDKKIRDDTSSDMAEAYSLLVSLDGEDVSAFGERYQQVATMIAELQQGLDQHKRQFERNKMLQAFSEEAARIQMVCEEQLKFIRQQILANPDLVGKRPESINHISQTYVAAITNIEKVHEKCKDDYQLVLNQEIRLVDYYNVAPSQVEAIKRPLAKSLQDLDTATQTENEYIGALKMVMKHAKTEADLTRSISEMKSTLLKYAKPSLRTRLHLLPDLQDFNKRNDDLAKSVQLFFSMGDDFKKAKLYKSIGVARTASINKAVDHCQAIIRRMWAEIKVTMDDTKVRLDEMYRRQNGTNKLNEALRYVDDIKERISSLQFSGKSVAVEEGELKDLDREIKVTLTQKIEEMDILLASISDSDGLIRKQRAQLSTATDQLHHLIQVRQEQAQTEGNIALFLGIIDQVDELVLQILVAIENTAPHHAKVIQGKFVKADLQELLRCLVDTYKKNGPQINKLLASAKDEASKQFLDDNNRVAKRLEKTIDRWTKAQASATAREKELHTCINALNHEFFTKLALAKKKTSASGNSKRLGHNVARSSTPVTESSSLSSSSSSSLGSLPPPLGYSSSRRPSFQTSTLSVDHRMIGNPGRRSKTPNPTSSGKIRSTYVADPKNELDVQLGRIVNDSAFKVSVKMVSGEGNIILVTD